MREDLEVTRHLFRGSPCYIVRDPMTFQSQRLEPGDYELFVSIDAGRSLAETFESLAQRNKLSRSDEERFYQFVMGLHRLGFLHLPIADNRALYRRSVLKDRARRREKLLGFLFVRIPVWNPAAFLDRTVERVRPLFGKTAFCLWLGLMVVSGVLVVRHWSDLTQPVQGLLVARNVVLMWVMLIVLKVFHEFGHAYACRHYGGYVPEMGIYLILFTPCAYMDATASWGFTRKRDRIAVCLAGMYVESIIAAGALLVWLLTDPSVVHALAYNVVFLASVVTVLFNINPLMRFDGYYILSDLLEIPNLRARSSRYILSLIKRLVLRLPPDGEVRGWRLRSVLVGYGVAAVIYRIVLLVAIAAILASKMFVLGMALAVFFIGATIAGVFGRLVRYLLHSEETAPIRGRAIAVGVIALAIIPAGLAIVPVPARVRTGGVLIRERETVVRAKTAGFLEEVLVSDGRFVEQGDPLAELSEDSCVEEIAVARANLRASDIRGDAYRVDEPERALQEEERAKAYILALEQGRSRLADLRIAAPVSGRVVRCLDDSDTGRFVPEGAPIATIVSGRWQARSILTEDQMRGPRPTVGDEVEFRAAAMPQVRWKGTVARVAPAGSRAIDLAPLTHLGGGDIAVDPQTGEAQEPYFEVTISLLDDDIGQARYGMTGTVQFNSVAEPVMTKVIRRVARFVNKLIQE